MTDLSDFGGGVTPEKKNQKIAHDTRTERAKHRRRQYRLGRCRAISVSKGARCGGGVVADSEGAYCHYHGLEAESPIESKPIDIDDEADILARWCGQSQTCWNDIPTAVQAALAALEGGE